MFYFISQKRFVLVSKVKIEVKTIGQELQNEVLYLHLRSSITLRGKYNKFYRNLSFSNFTFSLKYAETTMQNCKKCKNSRKSHILFLIKSPKPSKLQRWPFVLTFSLTFDSMIIIFGVWSKTFAPSKCNVYRVKLRHKKFNRKFL